jgi:hypothetical protein
MAPAAAAPVVAASGGGVPAAPGAPVYPEVEIVEDRRRNPDGTVTIRKYTKGAFLGKVRAHFPSPPWQQPGGRGGGRQSGAALVGVALRPAHLPACGALPPAPATRARAPPRGCAQGGFAKCYAFTAMNKQRMLAGKVIPKASLVKPRAKAKVSVGCAPRDAALCARMHGTGLTFRRQRALLAWRVVSQNRRP